MSCYSHFYYLKNNGNNRKSPKGLEVNQQLQERQSWQSDWEFYQSRNAKSNKNLTNFPFIHADADVSSQFECQEWNFIMSLIFSYHCNQGWEFFLIIMFLMDLKNLKAFLLFQSKTVRDILLSNSTANNIIRYYWVQACIKLPEVFPEVLKRSLILLTSW